MSIVRRSRGPRTARAVALASLVMLLGAACSGGDEALPEADIVMVGTDRLTWEPDRVMVEPGTRSVAIVCERGANHNFVIEETGEEVAACAPGRTAFGEVTLEPGNYTVVCTVPGHEVTMRAALAVAVR
jgi:plastocyanin